MLEWFLLIICKVHTLTRSANIFSRNHLTLSFWLRREGRQMSNTEQLLCQTDKSSQWRCSKRKAVVKNFAIFTGKHLWWSLFFIKLQTFRLATISKRDSTPKQVFSCCEIFKNTYFKEHMHMVASELTLRSDCLELCVWTVTFKTILSQKCYKNTSRFQTRACKPHMLPLYLTPKLSFEPRFRMSIINRLLHKKQRPVVLGLLA